jgi:hypothetical protein
MAHKHKNLFAMLTYKFFLHLKFAHAATDIKQQPTNTATHETMD